MKGLIIAGLVYVLVSIPAVIVVFLVNEYLLNKIFKSLVIKRNIVIFLLFITFTPIIKTPGAALISTLSPSYTVVYDLLVSGNIMHLNYHMHSHTVTAILSMVLSFIVSTWVAL